jgi:hypothetical protein
MACPSFDTATGSWAPQANISWVVGSVRESEFVRFPKRVGSENEAVSCALSAARTWIDKRLRQRHNLSPDRDETRIRRTPLMPSKIGRGGAVQLSRTVKSPRNAPGMLTFNQFKSMVVKSGLSSSQERLQKSYASLLQLRRQNHYSWAKIKLKMRNAQEIASTVQAVSAERLPVTIRDWRRII